MHAPSSATSALTEKRERLIQTLSEYGSCAVAFSGGIDSAVVAKAAQLALGDEAVLVTGSSAALAEGELDQARQFVDDHGMRHVVVNTSEIDDPNYVANAADRCYHCKSSLYEEVCGVAARLGLEVIVNGANLDDLDDYRPGLTAARENSVMSPLAECGFTKNDVRDLAREWQLTLADKPATPCLASRIAYGLEVTRERLSMIDRAEQFLRSLGFGELRVRLHGDDLARIEVPPKFFRELCEPQVHSAIVAEFSQLGFKFVTLDLAGFRSGSFRALISSDELTKFTRG